MIKHYVSHFIFFHNYGFLKQHVIKVNDGYVTAISPLTEEMESVEWKSGVIALLTEEQGSILSEQNSNIETHYDFFQESNCILKEIPDLYQRNLYSIKLKPYLFFPFDFTVMRPACGTQHKLLP